MGKLDGKVAYVTGAGAGIARDAARLFASEGARVGLAEVDPDTGSETAQLIRDDGGEARFMETDVTEADQVEGSIAETVAAFGRLDVIYNVAGGSAPPDDTVVDMPLDAWWRNHKIDLYGTFLGCRFAIPHLQAAGGGSIINMTSVMALIGELEGFPARHAYSAAKGGVLALTRCIAATYAKDRIRANSIAPCFIETERNRAVLRDQLSNAQKAVVYDQHRLGTGEARDIASLALFLASDESRLISGSVIPVDSAILAV
jgi:NAD(P)-dependent dehydrogenase (short-subunit alcohol dehydrogenase family)